MVAFPLSSGGDLAGMTDLWKKPSPSLSTPLTNLSSNLPKQRWWACYQCYTHNGVKNRNTQSTVGNEVLLQRKG